MASVYSRRFWVSGTLVVAAALAVGVPSAGALPPGQVVPGATMSSGIGLNGNVFVFGDRAWRVMPAPQLGRFTLISVDLATRAVRRVPFVLQPPADSPTTPTRLEWGFALGNDGLYMSGTWCGPAPRPDRFEAPEGCFTDPQARHTAQSFDPATGAARPWDGFRGLSGAPSSSRAPYLTDQTQPGAAPQSTQRRLYDIETGTPTATVIPSGPTLDVVNNRALLLTSGSGDALSLARSATVVDISTGRTLYTADLTRAARTGRGILKSENVHLQQNGSLSLRIYQRPERPDPLGLRPVAITSTGRIRAIGRTIKNATDVTTAWAPKRTVIGASINDCPRGPKDRSGNWILDDPGARARRLPGEYNTDIQWDGKTLLTGFGSLTIIRRGLASTHLSHADLPTCATAHR